MADDIDELLDEVEDSLSNLSNDSFSSNKRVYNSTKSESVKTDDLTDLLDDLDEPPLPSLPSSLSSRKGTTTPTSNTNAGSRCSVPHLAGTSVPLGLSTGVTLRACDQLRCVKCDMAVVMVDGFSWSDTVDYLFLRNNYPNLDKLCARMEPRRGGRAYACQCHHASLTEPTTTHSSDALTWVCGGHSTDDD